ncbi:AAA family ATPase [Pseudomonas fluorescens]|uniref:AAA family ATPase n=1 Tax=Pseudomonas fluorescens TaxID=294 RepID=UPI00187877DF|nr:AAA family ATPase [Pseudomonas fluorescens]
MIDFIKFQDWGEVWRTIPFVAAESLLGQYGFRSTIVTGQNGSYKSTMLRELVAGVIAPKSTSAMVTVSDGLSMKHVICASGSVADRFPSKEKSGGGSTEFATEQYAYIGQRVGANLLSKKRPFETVLVFALDGNKSVRYEWPFYKKAHEFANIVPELEILVHVHKDKARRSVNVPRVEQGAAAEALRSSLDIDDFRASRHFSESVAINVLNEFDENVFKEFSEFIRSSRSTFVLNMGSGGIRCKTASNDVVRLGFMLDIFSLRDVKVQRVGSQQPFSIFELSSGEYHMYTNLMGLGFGVEEGSLMLLDEPDNSLHPQWQRDFMAAVHGICQVGMKFGHLIVCTHSPLIVGAALEGSTIVDLSNDEPIVSVASFGASSDDILLEQFGITSSRNRIVVDVVQRAVSIIEKDGFEHPDLLALTDELVSIKSALKSEDPLVEVIEAILGASGDD